MERKSMASRSSYSTKSHKSTSKQLKSKNTHCEEPSSQEKSNLTVTRITTFSRTWRKTSRSMLMSNTWERKALGEGMSLPTPWRTTNSQIHTMTQGTKFWVNSTSSQTKSCCLNQNPLSSPSEWHPTISSSNNSTPPLLIGSNKSNENILKTTAFTLDSQRIPKPKFPQNINTSSVLALWLMTTEGTLIMKTTLARKQKISPDLCIKMPSSPTKMNP